MTKCKLVLQSSPLQVLAPHLAIPCIGCITLNVVRPPGHHVRRNACRRRIAANWLTAASSQVDYWLLAACIVLQHACLKCWQVPCELAAGSSLLKGRRRQRAAQAKHIQCEMFALSKEMLSRSTHNLARLAFQWSVLHCGQQRVTFGPCNPRMLRAAELPVGPRLSWSIWRQKWLNHQGLLGLCPPLP